jgi:hypothetical protein
MRPQTTPKKKNVASFNFAKIARSRLDQTIAVCLIRPVRIIMGDLPISEGRADEPSAMLGVSPRLR